MDIRRHIATEFHTALTTGDHDRLRAILHNCLTHGPSTQNRERHPAFAQHLRGRITWVAQHDPVRGARLLAQHDAVDWSR